MSLANFEKAFKLAKQCQYYHVQQGKSDNIIKTAEEKLGLKFSQQMYIFLSKYAYLSFFGNEFFGISKDDFSGNPNGNMVETAIADRKEWGLPLMWLPIYDFSDGYMAYQDYTNIKSNQEPPIIEGLYNGDEYIKTDTLAEDFGDFVLQMVQEQLNNQ